MIDPIYYDINIYKGEDFSLNFTPYVSGTTPMDLTESTVTATLREYPEGASATNFTVTHDSNQITITMAREVTNTIGYSYGWFEVKVTKDGLQTEVLHGKAFVLPTSTRTYDYGIPYTVVSYPKFDDFPIQGSTTRLYIDLETNRLYGWNGTMYFSVANGLKGDTATIAVGTVTTGQPGTNVIITNSGDSHDAVFNFTIPRGDKGSTGNTGPQGPQGVKGDKGNTGTITVGSTTTLPVGSDATVENVGTNTDAILNFGIPRGEGVWGNITGYIWEQEDLYTELYSKARAITKQKSGEIIHITDSELSPTEAKGFMITMRPKQEGSGTPSPTNIRPISGWTKADIIQTKKNLVTTTMKNCNINSSGYITENDENNSLIIARVKQGETYCFTPTVDGQFVCAFFEDAPEVGAQSYNQSRTTDQTNPWVAPITGYIAARVRVGRESGAQVEFGETPTAFEARSVYTKKYNWQSTAGTIYGGTLDPTNGILLKNYTMVNALDLEWELDSDNTRFVAYLSADADNDPDARCNALATLEDDGTTEAGAQGIEVHPGGGASATVYLANKPDEIDTVVKLTAWLTELAEDDTPLVIVYKTNESSYYSVASNYIVLQDGENHIWTDIDSTIDITYALDTKKYIDSGLSGKANTADLGSMAAVDDAPSDGKEYARKNGAWSEVEGGSGGGGDDKADVIITSASGAVASFSDGADGMPVAGLTVAVEPQQDLHGYDSPWPAGAKNLINETEEWYSSYGGISSTFSNGTWTVTSTASNNRTAYLPDFTLPAGTYYFSLQSYSTSSSITLRTEDDVTTLATISNGTKSTSFTLSEETTMHLRSSIISGDPSTITGLMLATSDIPYAPYSNVCPISGWTGCNVYHEDEYDAEAEPEITISWQSEAGTVYGGTLNVLTGVLTVDRVMVDLGTLTWTYNLPTGASYYIFYSGVTGLNQSANTFICSNYPFTGNSWTTMTQDKCCARFGNTSNRIAVRDDSYSDAATFKTAMSGVQLVYYLATPLTYTLTAQQLTTLLGDNNIWSDTGDTSVSYRADTKRYIDGKIASAIADLQALILEN